MSKALKTITSWIAAAVVALALAACSSPGSGESPAQDPTLPPAVASPEGSSPAEPGDEPTGFGGMPSTETITANNMEIEVPTGIRIPEGTLVTEAGPNAIMMADEDPSAVIAMVTQSAAEAGYEVYAEPAGSTLFVGQTNAVLFSAGPNFQMLTWGPEEMKDALANG